MTLYAYCLCPLETGCILDVAGVDGARPRFLPCGEIAAVVSDFAGERVKVGREQVFAHERVVQRVLQQVTPLPFRFGTLATPERLEAYITANREALWLNLERVRDSVEMSVKIIWDAEAVRRAGQEDGQREEAAGALGKGAAYLAAKRREMLGDKFLRERAEELASWLSGRVGEAADGAEVQVRPSEALVVRAAYLVGRGRLEDYQERVDRARSARRDLRFLTSGPWPPYSFSHIKP
jgi:hypothetical protein